MLPLSRHSRGRLLDSNTTNFLRTEEEERPGGVLLLVLLVSLAEVAEDETLSGLFLSSSSRFDPRRSGRLLSHCHRQAFHSLPLLFP